METQNKTSAELLAAKALAGQLKKELTGNILPYWMNMIRNQTGSFYGRVDGKDEIDASAPVGSIMTARILWTFASAYRIIEKTDEKLSKDCLEMAVLAKNILKDKFIDKKFGGVYWALNPDMSPYDTKKQVYAIAFAIYGLAEFNRATGDTEALDLARNLFHSIEAHCSDQKNNGYFEAFTQDWKAIDDMRLSDKDANECKSMNTHLHILEAYTCLYRVWKDPLLKKRLTSLISIFEEHIIGKDHHLRLFFNNDWDCGYDIISYGHDIEASWLMEEAAIVLDDPDITTRIRALVPKVVASASEGFSPDGAMIYEKHGNRYDKDRHWWVQAESVVGYFNLWDRHGIEEGLENALLCWEFIKSHLIDTRQGEWFWSILADGSVNRMDDKAGFWKCPYHNGRMCMEVIERMM